MQDGSPARGSLAGVCASRACQVAAQDQLRLLGHRAETAIFAALPRHLEHAAEQLDV